MTALVQIALYNRLEIFFILVELTRFLPQRAPYSSQYGVLFIDFCGCTAIQDCTHIVILDKQWYTLL